MRFNPEAESWPRHDVRATGDAVTRLRPDADASSRARAFLAHHAHQADYGGDAVSADLVAEAVVLVSELVSNAVLHAGTTIEVRVHCDRTVIAAAVTDDGPSQPPGPGTTGMAGPDAVTGRGLAIVEALATTWGITAHHPPPGKTVWFELASDPAAGQP